MAETVPSPLFPDALSEGFHVGALNLMNELKEAGEELTKVPSSPCHSGKISGQSTGCSVMRKPIR